jgi:hypothetical protein
MVGACGKYGGQKRCIQRRPEGRRLLRRHRRRWEGNVKMGLQGVKWESMNWIYLADDRDRWRALVNAVMNLRVPFYMENSLTS